MKRLLLCAVIIASIGTFLIGTNWVLAEGGSPNQEDDQTLVSKAIESLGAAIKYLEKTDDDFDGQKPAVIADAKKAVEQLKKVDKPAKKAGCRPGSLMMRGVGC